MEFDREYNDFIKKHVLSGNMRHHPDADDMNWFIRSFFSDSDSKIGIIACILFSFALGVPAAFSSWNIWKRIAFAAIGIVVAMTYLYITATSKDKQKKRLFNHLRESFIRNYVRERRDWVLHDLRNEFQNQTIESADDPVVLKRLSYAYVSQQESVIDEYKYIEKRLLEEVYLDPDIAKKLDY